MSSISNIQVIRALEKAIYELYSEGEQPLFSEIAQRAASDLVENPPGQPLPVPVRNIDISGKSKPHVYNKYMGFTIVNLGVLYQACLAQIEESIEFTSSLQSKLERLRKKRNALKRVIDDNLLSVYNTDGYFAALSDTFNDLSNSDLALTSAFIDTQTGSVSLPASSSAVKLLTQDQFNQPSIVVNVNGEPTPYNYTTVSSFNNAILADESNTAWIIEVETEDPSEVILTATMSVGSISDPLDVTRIEYDPYGSSETQAFIQVSSQTSDAVAFGSRIQKSRDKMVFTDSAEDVTSIQFVLRKTEPDYVDTTSGSTSYKYLFGAKSIRVLFQAYDSFARYVSRGLTLPETDSGLDYVIDAVSLTTQQEIPAGTSIQYFVAVDNDEASDLEDFNWRPISPINEISEIKKVVRFDGSRFNSYKISFDAVKPDLAQIPLSPDGVISDRNPSPSIIPGVDVYKIAEISDQENILSKSVSLIEGVNTTRILSRPVDLNTPFSSITPGFWSSDLRGANTTISDPDEGEDRVVITEADVDFGSIDNGNGFFYGGDIGESGKDVYVEAFLESDRTVESFISEFRKSDPKSKTWDVKVYLNGDEIGFLPRGTDSARLPWNIKKGINHVCLLVRIPKNSDTANAYIGAVELMGDRSLVTLGTVRLAKWIYVDLFNLKYNDDGKSKTFTIDNGIIITRRKPTTNYQIRYGLNTRNGVQGLRFRADLNRDSNNPNISPRLDEFRLRFAFGN